MDVKDKLSKLAEIIENMSHEDFEKLLNEVMLEKKDIENPNQYAILERYIMSQKPKAET